MSSFGPWFRLTIAETMRGGRDVNEGRIHRDTSANFAGCVARMAGARGRKATTFHLRIQLQFVTVVTVTL